jgi:hypothetical protein
MAKILDLLEQKRHLTAKKGFEPWSRRFRIPFDDNTSIRQLDNSTLKYLIRGGEDSAVALYELIMGIKNLGPGHRFHYLDNESKMNVTDVTLFLLDLLRFEAMYRLGWLDDYPFLSTPLLDLVQEFAGRYAAARHQCPSLTPSHPKYSQYIAEFEPDRNSFIRRLIPDAIQKFYAEG